ncbi:MAG: chemotaxis protein CheD [Bryobacteraceae bacterium]|nr:chemotaxis protein CheD [Bryobacteraceae bacterium]
MRPREEHRRVRAIPVAVGELRVSVDTHSYLVSYSLSSCIAIGVYDPSARIGAMLHFMLPDSHADPRQAALCPALFADTGVALLLARLKMLGCAGHGLRVRLAGGAQVISGQGTQALGKRNYLAARKVLWKASLTVEGETVGGSKLRQLGLPIDSGRFWVRDIEYP